MKASVFSLMMTAGSAASGFVSIAVTKIARGDLSGAGILLKGRVRNAVHMPESSRFFLTASSSRSAISLPE